MDKLKIFGLQLEGVHAIMHPQVKKCGGNPKVKKIIIYYNVKFFNYY